MNDIEAHQYLYWQLQTSCMRMSLFLLDDSYSSFYINTFKQENAFSMHLMILTILVYFSFVLAYS